MKRHRGLRFGIAALLLTALAGWAFGEVAVELDQKGKYRHVLILQGMQGSKPIIWQPVREAGDSNLILNPRGDEVGDLAPTVRENPVTGLPWAVWSYSDGTDYELAYSFFNGRQWVATRMVKTGDNASHDFDPSLAFTRGGTGVLAWWRAEPVPQVYLSFLEEGKWSAPLRISHPEIDSRHPSVRVIGQEVVVSYRTETGTETFTFGESSFLTDPQAPSSKTQGTTTSGDSSTSCDPDTDADCDISDGPDIDPRLFDRRPRKN